MYPSPKLKVKKKAFSYSGILKAPSKYVVNVVSYKHPLATSSKPAHKLTLLKCPQSAVPTNTDLLNFAHFTYFLCLFWDLRH